MNLAVVEQKGIGQWSETLFRFGYERSLCEGGEALTSQVLQGAAVLATYASSDFTLLKLDHAPPPEFEPYFNGWKSACPVPATSSPRRAPYRPTSGQNVWRR